MGCFATERTGNVLACTMRMRDRAKRPQMRGLAASQQEGWWVRRVQGSTGFPFHPGRATSSRAGHLKQRKAPGNPRGVHKYTECEDERVGRRTSKPCSRGGAGKQRKAFRKLENQKSRAQSARKKPSRQSLSDPGCAALTRATTDRGKCGLAVNEDSEHYRTAASLERS